MRMNERKVHALVRQIMGHLRGPCYWELFKYYWEFACKRGGPEKAIKMRQNGGTTAS